MNAAGAEGASEGPAASGAPQFTPGTIEGASGAASGPPITSISAAPPTHRGTAPRHRRPPVWPTVIGTISIIFGASAVLLSLWAILMVVVMSATGASIPGAGVTPRVVMLTSISGVLGALVAALLLVAGIQTCRRRHSGRATHLTWAVLKLVYTLIATVLGYYTQQEQLAAMVSNPPPGGGPNPAAATGIMTTMLAAQLALTALWYAAYPIFILIWFNTKSTKHDCATWK